MSKSNYWNDLSCTVVNDTKKKILSTETHFFTGDELRNWSLLECATWRRALHTFKHTRHALKSMRKKNPVLNCLSWRQLARLALAPVPRGKTLRCFNWNSGNRWAGVNNFKTSPFGVTEMIFIHIPNWTKTTEWTPVLYCWFWLSTSMPMAMKDQQVMTRFWQIFALEKLFVLCWFQICENICAQSVGKTMFYFARSGF